MSIRKRSMQGLFVLAMGAVTLVASPRVNAQANAAGGQDWCADDCSWLDSGWCGIPVPEGSSCSYQSCVDIYGNTRSTSLHCEFRSQDAQQTVGN